MGAAAIAPPSPPILVSEPQALLLDSWTSRHEERVLLCPECEQLKASPVSLEVGSEMVALAGPQLMGEQKEQVLV